LRAASAFLQRGHHRDGYLRKQLKKKYQFSQIIGSAPKMQAVFKMIERVAIPKAPSSFWGKAGRARNWWPGRCTSTAAANSPFCTHQLQRLAESLLESELFGHRGALYRGD